MVAIELVQGDITQLKVDAIVNAANLSLLGGGGVDGAIHRAAGSELLDECRMLKGCNTGQAKYTNAYNLPANWIIHTVGPIWKGGANNEDQLLQQCYENSFQLAVKLKLQSIAFPNISTGVYGFPKERAAVIAIKAVKNFPSDTTIEKIVFAVFDAENYTLYKRLL